MSARRELAVLLCSALFACRGTHSRADSTKATSPSGPPDAHALLSLADSAYRGENFDSARALYLRAHDRAVASSDTLAQALALTQLGLASWHRGDYEAARTFGERAVALKITAGLTKELAKSYNALGLLAHNQGRFSEAIAEFTRAEQTATELRDSARLATARGNRGLVHSDIGDFSSARTEIGAQLRFARLHGDTIGEANALNNLGMVEIRAGDARRALPLLLSARRLAHSSSHAAGEENALGQLGTAYDAMGEPQLALDYLDSALTIATRRGFRQQESDDLQLIAALYEAAGDHARSLDFLSRAAPLADSMGMRKIQGDIARAQARARVGLGDLREGRQRVAAADRFHANAGATLEQLEDQLFLADLAERDHSPGAADASLARAHALASQIDSRVARIELAIGEAGVAELRARPADVLRHLGRVHDDLNASPTGREWEAPALAARAYARMGRFAEAERAGRDAVRAVERVRANFASGALRTSFTAARAGIYADLVVTLLHLGKTSDALAVADAARSRALLEHLAVAGRDSTRRGSAADLVAAEQLLRRIDQLVERLRLADTASPRRRTRLADDESGFLSRQLADSRREYETLMRRAGVADRRTSAMTGAALPDADALRSSLRPTEALIEYFVTPTQLVTFVVTSTSVRALETAITEESLTSRVRLARDLLSQRNIVATTRDPVLAGLYQVLVQPVIAAGLLGGVRTLVIVPHAVLAYLPFAGLLDPASNQYLIQRFSLVFEPSAASLVAVRLRPTATTAIGQANVFAPFPRDLPGSGLEADEVARTSPGSHVVVGEAATERAVRAALADTKPVHVATHGILNPRSPMFSRLELARPSTGDGFAPTDDDGRLEVHELLDLTIRSPLVFLSGCETGLGPAGSTSFARGEDYATLAEAFLFAGARNVVSTLWRIEDRGAAGFARAFYNAAAHQEPVEALATAQRTLIGDPEYGSPYYWAAYALTGDGRPLSAQVRSGLSVQ
jgi:CHAT domain-containing protein/tetratricopeptide (TPR) repeat protein